MKLNHTCIYILKSLIVAFVAAIAPVYANAAAELAIESIKAGSNNDFVSNLLDDNTATEWHSADELTDDSWVEITLKTPVTLGDDDALVFRIRRPDADNMHPTALQMRLVADDGSLGDPVANIFLFYRGKHIVDYSERIYLNEVLKGQQLKKFRLTVTATNTYTVDEFGDHNMHMRMSYIGVSMVKKHEPYSTIQLDRLHRTTDYDNTYRGYSFRNTPGVLEPANRTNNDDIRNWCDWTGWSDGLWTKDADVMKANSIEFPRFDMLTGTTTAGMDERNKLIFDNQLADMLPAGQTRQRAHTSEHIVYAIPGDAVALYPFYEMDKWAESSYHINFSHWYDWRTGGHITVENEHGEKTNLLDLAIDPSLIKYSDNHGYFGGPAMKRLKIKNGYYRIYNALDWIMFVTAADTKEGAKYNAEIMNDIDFDGWTVPMLGTSYDNRFQGKIDGRGHTFKNLKMKTTTDGCGLICRIGENAVIKNLRIDESCSFTATDKVGAIFGISQIPSGKSASIENVDTRATIRGTASGAWLVGGVFGYLNDPGSINIKNCHVGGYICADNNSRSAVSAMGHINFWDNNPNGSVWENIYLDPTFNVVPQRFPFQFRVHNNNSEINWTDFEQKHLIRKNTYSTDGQWGFALAPSDYLTNPTSFVATLGSGFEVIDGKIWPTTVRLFKDSDVTDGWDEFLDPDKDPAKDQDYHYKRVYGTTGTFFYPRNPLDMDEDQSLPVPDGKEYVVAADFSCNFDFDANLTEGNGSMTIIEPTVHFRHIFRIRDGRTQAESMSGSVDNSRDYLRRNKTIITARTDKPFQTRLINPVPEKIVMRDKSEKKTGLFGSLYYKAGNNDYRRIGSSEIKVWKYVGSQWVEQAGTCGFEFGDHFEGSGTRWTNATDEYALCDGVSGGTSYFYRMLKCKKPEQGRYRVRLLANDVEGKPLYVFGSTTERLATVEYEITFHNDDLASVTNEETFYTAKAPNNKDYKYGHAWPETLQSQRNMVLGDRVNFDNLVALQDIKSTSAVLGQSDYFFGDGMKRSYKWPLELSSADYLFGYERGIIYDYDNPLRLDYNEYMIVSHSDMTPWHGQADMFPRTKWDTQYQDVVLGADGLPVLFDANGNVSAANGKPKGDIGLYDRLFYETRRQGLKDPSIEPRNGYFYYVNAATDPGKICTLEANSICMGSTIHVSAWIAEFSGGEETANLVFKFNAVLSEDAAKRDPSRYAGQRINIHAFVTGYLQQNDAKGNGDAGRWMNVYYNFTPRAADYGLQESDIAYYELQLINNTISSQGADYAIDDIAMYIENPSVKAEQLSMMCNRDERWSDVNNLEIKVRVPFDNMLQKIGKTEGDSENNEQVTMVYTIIDKQVFDSIYDRDVANSHIEAFRAAHVPLAYNSTGDNKDNDDYGVLTFSTYYEGNNAWKRYSTEGMRWEDADGVRYIMFNSLPEIGSLQIDKEYYIVMNLFDDLSDIENHQFGVDVFNVTDNCTPQGVFVIEPTTVVKIDGWVEDNSRTDYCENMQPVVQVNLRGEDTDNGDVTVIERSARFDWYNGNTDDFWAETMADGETTLFEVLVNLRDVYPDSTEVANIEPKEGDKFTEEMRDYIRRLATEIPEGAVSPKLTLCTRSYIFPPLKIPEGRETATVTVLALPIDKERQGYRICADPTPVSLTVRERAPLMRHGIRGVDYPERMVDVPLRASLEQLKAASADRAYIDSHATRLNVPIRTVQTSNVNENVGGMRLRTGLDADNNEVVVREITLVSTDDPEYDDLGTIDPDGNDKDMGLEPVGEITGLTADIDTPDLNIFDCVFYSDFNFKEGYTYSFRFPFEEKTESPNEKCPGHEVFTVKVVPAYLKWTGAESTNFNNDANWRRVNADEVYRSSDDTSDNFVDGTNDRIKAFAPLDFTKVIIGRADDTAPELRLAAVGSSNVSVKGADGQLPWFAAPGTASASATADIEYDMAGFYGKYNGVDGVYCRPWYANTCDQVHFLPGSEILGQQHLGYNRAWVDFEMAANYWHLVSSPLKETFAGEFYLPTKGARQLTPMFDPINYSTVDNNRFLPAVYQRSWNTSKAMVYELAPGTNRNVCVKAGWSNVYNDVTERYGRGYGFSIKTDPTGTGVADGGNVLFRLPKADDSYKYFEKDKPAEGQLEHSLNRTAGEHYRLNDVAGTLLSRTQTETRYFLVGNPFMAHLDMQKFLTHPANAAKIKPHYWVASNGAQQQGVLDSATGTFVGSASGYVAPMQSFFVEMLPGAELGHEGSGTVVLSLEYTAGMSCLHRDDDAVETAALSRSGMRRDIRISAISGDRTVSEGLLCIDPDAANGYDPIRDVVALDNSEGLGIDAIVYIMSGDMAGSVVTRNALEGTELGIAAHGAKDVTLRFDGIDDYDDLALYNAGEDSYTDIYDGLEISLCGATSGLYMVKRSSMSVDGAEISYSLDGRELTVVAPAADAELHVAVADVQGRMYYDGSTTGRAHVSLPAGIYVLGATDGDHRLTTKIMVR